MTQICKYRSMRVNMSDYYFINARLHIEQFINKDSDQLKETYISFFMLK